MFTRRELLKGGIVAPVGLIVVASGIMENDGQHWRFNQGWDGRADATVFLYGRLSMTNREAHATPQQISAWIDREAQELKVSWLLNHNKAMADRDEMRRLWQPQPQRVHPHVDDYLLNAAPDPHFYEGK